MGGAVSSDFQRFSCSAAVVLSLFPCSAIALLLRCCSPVAHLLLIILPLFGGSPDVLLRSPAAR
eukprot:14492545-Alexandrium_andersonii.AAC.1